MKIFEFQFVFDSSFSQVKRYKDSEVTLRTVLEMKFPHTEVSDAETLLASCI